MYIVSPLYNLPSFSHWYWSPHSDEGVFERGYATALLAVPLSFCFAHSLYWHRRPTMYLRTREGAEAFAGATRVVACNTTLVWDIEYDSFLYRGPLV